MALILIFLAIIIGLVKAQNETLEQDSVTVAKCCEVDSILVESALGVRICRKRTDLLAFDLRMARSSWEPAFKDDEGREVLGPRTIVVKIGNPKCDFANGDLIFPVSHSRKTDDELMLLSNGTLSHRYEEVFS
jgi:hypothetical protein